MENLLLIFVFYHINLNQIQLAYSLQAIDFYNKFIKELIQSKLHITKKSNKQICSLIKLLSKGNMKSKQPILSPQQIEEFKSYLTQELSSRNRKLTGDQMTKLKKTHFTEYIKKIKYYAKKDLQKITQNNAKLFYPVNALTNYQNREEPKTIIKKQKPSLDPQTHQPSYYYYGKAEISSMKEFVFLAEECHRIQQNMNKFNERRRNSEFIKKVEKIIQSPNQSDKFHSKSLSLRLTLKSAKQIEQNIDKRRKSLLYQVHSQRKFDQSLPKSFVSTNFTSKRSNSTDSLRRVFFNR